MIWGLRFFTEEFLPDGCPFVIGGGLIRDGLGGARPGDIDIWLPSNIRFTDCEVFRDHFLDSMVEGSECRIVFRGPDARGTLGYEAAVDAVAYSDVNNHWVMECDIPNAPKVNFMRSMTEWHDDSQEFFNGLMRAFDIDICMMFMGYAMGQEEPTHIIMPEHIVKWWDEGSFQGDRYDPRLNIIYWNASRWATTAKNRTEARISKMNSKYAFDLTLESIRLIETDDIIATPVTLKKAMDMRKFIYPFPTPEYQNEPEEDWFNGTEGAVLQAS